MEGRYNPAMRRLARWTLNAVTVLSLLLCGAAALIGLVTPAVDGWTLSVQELQVWAMKTRPLSDPNVAPFRITATARLDS